MISSSDDVSTRLTIPRLVIAGAQSGVGKTTLSVGLIGALRQRGLTVQPFKVGPDYIDPTYHTLAAGRPCHNLDTWMLPLARVRDLFGQAVSGADVALIEGVMGLYDGFGYDDEQGSTAQVAKLLDAPVLLALDAGKMARSAGALALGYQKFDPELRLAGFMANRVGSESHGQGVATAIQQATRLPVLGQLPRQTALKISERHLGLIPTIEPGEWQAFVEAAAEYVNRHVDLEQVLSIARQSPALAVADPLADLQHFHRARASQPRPVIAVARDAAFSFTYPANLELLEAAGAELVFFSPLRDPGLPPKTAGVILSGGFPELQAAQLAANTGMHQALRAAHRRGLPIYAECGGLMYLTETILDLQGQAHPMVGLLPGRSLMSGKLTLGYRLAQASHDSWLFSAHETIRGHEFHYSAWEQRPADLPAAYTLLPRNGQGAPRPEGACLGSLWASYVHLHFWAKPEMALRFAKACREAAL